jgi:hypothetical protein
MCLTRRIFAAGDLGLIRTLVLRTKHAPVEALVSVTVENQTQYFVRIYCWSIAFRHFRRTTHTYSIAFITANCEPLGNVLIIQNERKPVRNPNDSAKGGCFVFNFTRAVALINFGLLDTERIVNITVRKM